MIITLATDFGTRDGYVGAMKGVLARLAPGATIVDLAHDIPRHDIAHAAWVVATACREFPIGSIHVVVVDPGVGGARRGVVVDAEGRRYVGPDNGTFAHLRAPSAWAIPDVPGASPTFHGRDVFAPIAARLATGTEPKQIGPAVALAGTLPFGTSCIVHVDHYGNLVTDLPPAARVTIAGRTFDVVATYEAVPVGMPLAYVGSAGTIEIAVREGRADVLLRVKRGEPCSSS